MPHFFFDLRNGSVLERDEFGLDLPDFESAYLEAHRAAIDIWSEARREGRKPVYRSFEIRDSQGRIVTELPFAEALNVPSKIPPAQWRPHLITAELVKTELAQTEAGIASGEQRIANQRARIARLEAIGGDVSLAKALLKTILETQKLHAAHRGLLNRELSVFDFV